jgi:dihydropteroate synthase
MHMRGEPRSMQADPTYDDAALDVFDGLAARIAACEAAGIDRARIVVDPGIGFGKTVHHNLEILEQLAVYHGLGCVLLLGASRKSFIARVSGEAPPKERVPGSLAAALAGLERGVQILRVHDVAETVQAVKVWRAITLAGPYTSTGH